MGDYQAYVEQSAAHVLSNHELLMSTPSASRLTSFYPTPSESQNTIAQAVINSGQLTVQANSKNFGQSSDFIISSPNLMDTPHLRLQIVIPKYVKTQGGNPTQAANLFAGSYHDGWGFDCIELLEITFSNSNISNLQITGRAMREWSLLQCKNEIERKRLLETAGKHKVGSREKDLVFDACVPLSFMFWRSAGGVKGGFPIDGRALNGPIVFRIRFSPISRFLGPHMSNFEADKVPGDDYPSTSTAAVAGQYGAGHGGVADFWNSSVVSGFKELNITFRTYQLMDGAFSVSKALEANPGFVYSIPSLWLNTYSYTLDLDSNGYGSINLNSAPAGMIQAMILTFRPENNSIGTQAESAAQPTLVGGGANSLLNYNEGAQSVTVATADGSEKLYRPYIPWSLPLSTLKLSYSGQAIFWARSAEEIDQFYEDVFQDDLKTDVCGAPLHLSVRSQDYRIGYSAPVNAGSLGAYSFPKLEMKNKPENASVMHNTQVKIIPLMHDGNDVFRMRGFENLPHYSGSTLQLEFNCKPYNTYCSNGKNRRLTNDADGKLKTLKGAVGANISAGTTNFPATVADPSEPEEVASECHYYPSNRTQFASYVQATANSSSVIEANDPTSLGAMAFRGSEGKIRVEVTYVIASLFQITNGVAELQL
jgi:hypothetical protein